MVAGYCARNLSNYAAVCLTIMHFPPYRNSELSHRCSGQAHRDFDKCVLAERFKTIFGGQ